MAGATFLLVACWLTFGALVGLVASWAGHYNKLLKKRGRVIAVLLCTIAPFAILYALGATVYPTDGWGLYSLPLSVAGGFLGYAIPVKPAKYSLLIAAWQLLIGEISVYLYLGIMDYNDYSFTYYPAQYRLYGLDYNSTLNILRQALDSEMKATILYIVIATLLLTLPFPASKKFLQNFRAVQRVSGLPQ